MTDTSTDDPRWVVEEPSVADEEDPTVLGLVPAFECASEEVADSDGMDGVDLPDAKPEGDDHDG